MSSYLVAFLGHRLINKPANYLKPQPNHIQMQKEMPLEMQKKL
jgi:hypothetical protein